MTNNKKSALEQLREICASLDKVLENAPPNCEKPELEVTVGALHIACLLELAEKVEALAAKHVQKVCRCNEPDLADDGACRRCLGKPTSDARTIVELPDDTFDEIAFSQFPSAVYREAKELKVGSVTFIRKGSK